LFASIPVRAAGYDFYVDKNSSETAENGSEQQPWKTIGSALGYIENHNLENRHIFIKSGTYEESIEIKNDTDLTGESEPNTIIDASGSRNAVNFDSTSSQLKNITVKNAQSTNIVVSAKSKATITNCTIKNAGKFGVEVEKSTTASKYKFTITKSKISDNNSKGFHLSKRKISITKNDVLDNGEEGIDLHSGQKGTVSENDIRGNGESGIELVLSGANLKIKKNKIKNNHTQGITIQVYSSKKKGKVKISGNTIEKNRDHGVRFANYTHSLGPQKFKIFIDKYVKFSGNAISDNREEEIYYE